ncbi:MAG: hypothetical protein NTZ05_08625 [Chloroflexi bacterium]|nr:hypothetical protein [Chloroflexota bacterium]
MRLPILIGAVFLLICQAFVINRTAGGAYPWWAHKAPRADGRTVTAP